MCTHIYRHINTHTSTYINLKELKHLILNITPLLQLGLNAPNTTCLHTECFLPLICDCSPTWAPPTGHAAFPVLCKQETSRSSCLLAQHQALEGQLLPAVRFAACRELR